MNIICIFCGKIKFLCKGRKNDVHVYDNSKIYENSKYHEILGWNKFKNIKLPTIYVQAIYTNTHPKHDLCKEKIYADEPFIQDLV